MKAPTVKIYICIACLLALCFCPLPVKADEPQAATATEVEVRAYQVWMLINQARMNPGAVLERLGIDRETAAAVLGDDAWVLDQGLAPLGWNDLLRAAANGHGRDMIDNLYYAHVSPEGVTSAVRIAAQGYEAGAENETLAALLFTNPFPVDEAVEALVDNMLRDELTGAGGQARAIFSPLYTETGVTFHAESLPLLAGQPYVYLLVVNYAQPLEKRSYMMGPIAPINRMVAFNHYFGSWREAEVFPGSYYQVEIKHEEGEAIYYWDTSTPVNMYTLSVAGNEEDGNIFVDLRQQ
jgi:hypothetical protein